MKKEILSLAMASILILVILATIFIPVKAGSPSAELSERYKKWLEEEVVYIITPKEKEVFQQLATDKERDLFIEAFWKQRDPTPGTPTNEFKDEHYRRINYANQRFGRNTPKPGWRTDQGKIYILLGEPLSIERYEGFSFVYPAQIWSYQGDQRYGLPAFFNIVFYQEGGLGEYKLYSPLTDGMQKLIIDKKIAGADPETAYQKLYEYDPKLAQAALSLIPSENPPPESPSLSSEFLMANVASLPRKMVKDEYADKLLKYKDIIEVDYTANYMSSEHEIAVIRDDRGMFFVSFAIEPENLSVSSFEEKYVAHFELNGLITDDQGRTVFQYGKSYPLELTEENLNQLKTSSFSLQDTFPLIPGSYRLNIILKNAVSKEFTSFERQIRLLPEENSFQISPILLGYKLEKSPSLAAVKKAFCFGDFQIMPEARNVFARNDKLIVFFQLFRIPAQLEKAGRLRISITNDQSEVYSDIKELAKLQDKKNFLLELPLADYTPGYYKIKAALEDEQGSEILVEGKNFQVTNAAAVARPWVISKVMPLNEGTQAELDFIIAGQHLARGELAQAREILERIHQKRPSLKHDIRLAEVLLQEKEFQKVKEILAAYQSSSSQTQEWLSLLGRAHQGLGEYKEAIARYKECLAKTGTNLSILNAVGDCYLLLGDKEEALVAWRKSLELDQNQPALKAKIEKIQKEEK
jgi:GWxTD domain-containing protein